MTHHKSRDVCLRGVRGQVNLFGRTALVFGVHHHTISREALEASHMIFLTRHGPVNGEGGGTNQGELEFGGWGDGWGTGDKKVRHSEYLMFILITTS